MKVSLSWLKQYIPIDVTLEEVTARLTMVGLEVDSVVDRFAWMDSVRVAQVQTVRPHPNADKLTLCEVDTGSSVARVVCGAPNVTEGMRCALALPGTEFPDGTKLTASTIRGEVSEGMLCSASELEIGDDHSGIMVLPPDTPLGISLSEALHLSDATIEIDLTPNRPDCLSIIGIAREIGAMVGERVRYPAIDPPGGSGKIGDRTSVTILSPEHCPRYAARLIEGITIKPSPFWLQERLLSVGLRPINNIVDVTNFVMMEMGQPLHAFDFDHLAEGRIVVRTAEKGETFTTLDGKSRPLDPEMLMICDAERSVAVGGVMGGLNSEIEESTTRVLIESAYFDPGSIRRTAKILGLGTDASHRFERGVDPERTVDALNRAAQLMLEVAGGELSEGVIDVRPRHISNTPVEVAASFVNARLGIDLGAEEMARLLESIEFAVERLGNDHLRVLPPTFRVDIERPEDLVEEIARLHGYDSIPVTFPAMPSEGVTLSKRMTLRNAFKDAMSALGFSEAINYSFIGADACDRLRMAPDAPERRLIHIQNPMSEDLAVMRTSLIPGLLMATQRNLSHQNRDLRLYETGMTFYNVEEDALPTEIEKAAAIWTGNRVADVWHAADTPVDFFDLKGVMEAAMDRIGVPGLVATVLPDEQCTFTRPGHSARILLGNQAVGVMGEIHPEVAAGFDLRQKVFAFEVDMEELLNRVESGHSFTPIPRFPSVSRDITIIIDKSVEAGDVLREVRGSEEAWLEDVFLFDLYEGEKMPAGRKSLSIRIVFRSQSETLSDEAVTEKHRRIADRLLTRFDASFPA